MNGSFIYDFHKYYKLKCKKKIYVTKGVSGLINYGNKCYVNSVLQCLSHSLILTDYILIGDYKNDLLRNRDNTSIANSYIKLLNVLWDENQVIKPISLMKNLCEINKFNDFNQHDSFEFLEFMLDMLHQSIKYDMKLKRNEIGHKENLTDKFLNVWENNFKNDYSYIIKNFYGCMYTQIVCDSKCKTLNNFEPFFALNISINDYSTLEESVDNYFKTEKLDGYICDTCKKKDCSKKNNIRMFPNYLIIHLKRFENNLTKKNNNITFPLENYDLTKYSSKENKNNYVYDCYAINYHSGNLNNGHYWSCCKNMDNKWYEFNDADTQQLSEEQLVNKNAYILFYYRKFI